MTEYNPPPIVDMRWEDYDGFSDGAPTSLMLNEKQRAILSTLLSYAMVKSAWPDVVDFDEIDEYLSVISDRLMG